jgi:hypothetical protein
MGMRDVLRRVVEVHLGPYSAGLVLSESTHFDRAELHARHVVRSKRLGKAVTT